MDYILNGLFILLAFGSILFLAFITTKYIAGKSSHAMKGRYINVVETVSLGMDKRLHLVKIDKQFILIASCNKKIEFLTALTLEEIDDGEGSNNQTFEFKQMFDKYIQSFKTKKDRTAAHDENKGLDYYENNSFKNNLKRLKAITRKAYSQSLEGKNDVLKDDTTNEK
jgi:flagellar protein FliO/FliZ